MTDQVIEGGCRCGAIRYRARGEPLWVNHCYCLDCRGTSGAPFVTWAVFPTAAFRIVQGNAKTCETRPGATRQFCGDCGTQLTFHDADDAEVIDVTAASLDEPDGLQPEDHIWCDRKLSWIQPGDNLPQYALRKSGGD